MGKQHFGRRTVLSAGGALAGGMIIPAAADAQSPAGRALVVGQVNLSFYAATAAIILEVFRRLSLETRTIEAGHADIYGRLGRGEVDVLIAAWLPRAHGGFHAPIADRLVEAATLYEDARLFWAVPAHVPADAVRSVADLRKPEIRDRMDREIVGISPGSGLMNGAERIMREYGLAEAGYSLRVGSVDEWSSRLERATRDRRWMVTPLWHPTYLNALYPVRILEEPLDIYGVNRAILVFHRDAWMALGERHRRVISRIAISIPDIAELDRQIVIERLPQEQVGQAWMERNAALVERWFAQA
jgi:glycine betaine/proline transport system substrate-binding protein